jgi:hypothetical protein
MTFEEAMSSKKVPVEIRDALVLLDLEYWGFDDAWHVGQLVVHRELSEEVQAIFGEIALARFPIAKMVPVVAYDWSDDLSMIDNNCSAFNYRLAVGKLCLSQHAYGRAIDINPVQNPYVKNELILPPGATYQPDLRGTVTAEGAVVAAFDRYGWTWGGRWQSPRDWQHFEKREMLSRN